MRVYWIVLQSERHNGLGFGITAHDWDDATFLLAQAGMALLGTPVDATMIETWKEVSDAAELEQSHVVPNMGMMLRRGVWFPNLPDIQ